MEMSHLASKFKTLKFEISEDLIIYLVLISLPVSFNKFKVSYYCQKKTWSLNELISHCVQEEETLELEKTESAHRIFSITRVHFVYLRPK
jgi:LTR polyprotein gag-polypeptide-like protein